MGDNIMRLIDLEVKREAVRQKERERSAAAAGGAEGGEERLPLPLPRGGEAAPPRATH